MSMTNTPTGCGTRVLTPPSATLTFRDGMWTPSSVTPVSYPEAGNDACYAVEDGSYWFRHRNDVILSVIDRFPPTGPIYDIGGGNGFVSLAIEAAGHDVVLVEPGSGAANAVRRGVSHVIHGTLEDAGFAPGSLAAASMFDVIEHIEDEDRFLGTIHRSLEPGGMVYCTVPAGRWLWSGEDDIAGHFRRYTTTSLRASFVRNGFTVAYISRFFSWLHAPIFLFRTLPYRLGVQRHTTSAPSAVKADHSLPAPLKPLASTAHTWELRRIRRGLTIPLGTSLICAARRL